MKFSIIYVDVYTCKMTNYKFVLAHAAAGILHATSVLVLVILAEDGDGFSVPLKINYNAWVPAGNETDCDTTQCMTMPTSTSVAEVNLLWACAIFGMWSALCHVIAVCVLLYSISEYQPKLRLVRAIDYAVSAPVMILVVYVISGGSDFTAAVVSAGLMSSVIWIDYFGRNTQTFVSASALYVLLWTPIFITFAEAAYSGKHVLVNSTLVESAKAPDFVIVIIVAIAFAFTSFAIARLATLKSFPVEEAAFITLSLVAKTTLHWTLYNGILNRPNMLACEGAEPTPVTDPTNDVIVAVAVSVSTGILLGIYLYFLLRKEKLD